MVAGEAACGKCSHLEALCGCVEWALALGSLRTEDTKRRPKPQGRRGLMAIRPPQEDEGVVSFFFSLACTA